MRNKILSILMMVTLLLSMCITVFTVSAQDDRFIEVRASGVDIDTADELIAAINGAIENDADITLNLTAGFAGVFSNTVTLPAIPSDVTAQVTIDGFSQTLSGINKKHFIIAAGNKGMYIFKNMVMDGTYNGNKAAGGMTFTGGNIKLDHVVFQNISSEVLTCGGAAVAAEGCTFSNLSGVAVKGHSTLTVNNTTFDTLTNYAIEQGQNVTVTNSLFKKVNKSGEHASAIRIGTNLTVSASSFINCGGGASWGGYANGAIGGLGTGRKVVISNCNFQDNIGNCYGGAISLYQFGGTVEITNSYFKNNSVQTASNKADGGAVGVFNNGQALTVTVNGCTFYGNTAADDAGAIFVESNVSGSKIVTVTVKNSTFYDNRSQRFDSSGSGGAIQLSLNCSADFINDTFYNNICKSTAGLLGKGAAVGSYSTVSLYPTATFQNNLMVGNEGSSGSKMNVQVSGLLSPANSATDNGGNIGYDASAAVSSALTVKTVFGADSLIPAANGSGMKAGMPQSDYQTVIPTLWIAPAISNAGGIYADGSGESGTGVPKTDQRGKDHGNPLDSGAVDIIWAGFDANGGQWQTVTPYTYETPVLYVSDSDDNPVNAYVAVNAGTSDVNADKPVNPAREGYIFLGWSTDPADKQPSLSETDLYVPAETAQTYYAVWREESNIDLTYYLNGGSGAVLSKAEGPYEEDTQVTVKQLSDVEGDWGPLSGYVFSGWAATPDAQPGETLYNPGDTFTVTSVGNSLYARWSRVWTVTYKPGWEDVSNMPTPNPVTIAEDASYNISDVVPERNGFKFLGWKMDDTDETRYQPGENFTMPGRNVVLTAQWVQNDPGSIDPDPSIDPGESKPSSTVDPDLSSGPNNSRPDINPETGTDMNGNVMVLIALIIMLCSVSSLVIVKIRMAAQSRK